MISTVSLSFDLSASPPIGIVTDSTDYAGLGLDLLLNEVQGYGVISFNGTVIEQHDTVLDPMIDLQNWDYATQGTPVFTFPLELDLNGNVANGVYTFSYSLRVNVQAAVAIPITLTPNDLVTVPANEWVSLFLEPGNDITIVEPFVASETVQVISTEQVGPDGEITVTDYTIAVGDVITFELTNLQLSGVYTYSGCTQTNADVNFVYDCEVGDNGSWAVSNATQLASNEIVASLNCAINYPSWATLSPTFPGNVVVTSLPYPGAPNVETPLATGTYTVSLTEQIQQTQTDGLILLYTRSVIKEFQVSCAGTLCGLVPCIENLRAAHQAELTRNKISKYQVYVDNVLMYYIEALNYKACGELDKYKAAIACIQAQLDASGCECACCDDETYYWVSNNSGVSVIESLIEAFQFRLFNLDPVGPGSPLITNDVTQGVEVGALWENVNTGVIYRCTDNTEGAAVWVEYYAPGILPTAAQISAVPGAILTGNDVQAQLNQVEALFLFDGINGLTKSGNDVGLGGTLTSNTTINVDNYVFEVVSDSDPLIVRAGDGVGLTSARAQSANTGVGQNLILETTTTAGNGANGLGSGIYFTAAPATSALAFPLSTIQSSWANATTQDSRLTISTVDNGVENIGITLNQNSLVTLNEYGQGTFANLTPPTYNLSVDSAGNVIELPTIIGYTGIIRTIPGPSVNITEAYNTTAATISINYIGVGSYTITASSGVFIGATAIFIQTQTAGFATATRNNNTTITVNTYSTAGVLDNAVVNGAYIKIEIYL